MRTTTKERRRFREQGLGPLAIDPRALDREWEASEDVEATDERAIAVVNVRGPLEHHASWWWASYDDIIACARDALEEESTLALVLRIDSPGGAADGMIEAAKKLRALGAKHKKPIFAYADECAASAAYGLACAAEEIWLPPSGRVGSVGVIAEVVDATKRFADQGYKVRLLTTGARKGDGHPAKPLDDEVESALQAQVDSLGELFFELVGEARGMTPRRVEALEAGVFMGKEAVDVGLADGVATYDDFIAHVLSSIGLAQSAEMGSTAPHTAQAGSEGTGDMSTRLQALAKVEETKKALLAAKTDKDRAAAALAFETAVEAATKYKKKTVEESEETDDEEESSEESEEETSEAEGEEEEEEEAEGESTTGSTQDSTAAEEDAKALLAAKTGLYTYSRLFRLCHQTARALTGKEKLTVQQVFDAIADAQRAAKSNAKLVARVAKLEQRDSARAIDALLEKATTEGRITPAQAKDFRAIGERNLKDLKTVLATMPKKAVRTLADGEIKPLTEFNAADPLAGLDEGMRKFVTTKAALEGKDPAELARELHKANKTSSNEVPRY